VRVRVVVPRVPTSPFRALPDFVVLGAQRGGTTSLFDALSAHRQVHPPPLKELHHFDADGLWPTFAYRCYFPMRSSLRAVDGERLVTGEATPQYLVHPEVPARVHAVLPRARFVVLLREPVARAWSHYRMAKARGTLGSASFREAVEEGRMETEGRRRRDHWVRPLGQHAFFERGLYAEQLERWFAHFPRDQFLLLRSEDWYADQAASFAEVCHHLRIEPDPGVVFEHRNRGKDAAIDPEDRAWLADRYREPNERLRALTGIAWD
jgi:hypothetical protein